MKHFFFLLLLVPLSAKSIIIGDQEYSLDTEIINFYSIQPVLPANFFRLKKLKVAIIHANLSDLPQEFAYLTSLEIIHFTNNKFRKLPSVFSKLVNLEKLYLPQNELTTLPSEIGTLKKLKYLDLKHNPLESLPSSMSELVGLEQLILSSGEVSSHSSPQTIANQLKDILLPFKNMPQLTIFLMPENEACFLSFKISQEKWDMVRPLL